MRKSCESLSSVNLVTPPTIARTSHHIRPSINYIPLQLKKKGAGKGSRPAPTSIQDQSFLLIAAAALSVAPFVAAFTSPTAF